MAPHETLGILEVLDNLNSIVEAESLDQLEVTEDYQFITHGEENRVRELYWMQAGPNQLTLDAVRENFRSALHYLQSFYQKVKNNNLEPERFIKEMNSVMLLVGEAAAKLERFDKLFQRKIPRLEELQGLQDFYKKVVVRPAEGSSTKASKSAREVLTAQSETIEVVEGAHQLDDIDLVKRDHRYELFYMYNEHGEDFYTDKLVERLKLGCDFGEYAKQPYLDDPLIRLPDLEDKCLQVLSGRIYRLARADIARFYKASAAFKDNALVRLFHTAVMALMLATNSNNLIRKFSPKGCGRYFSDFLHAVRALIIHRDYVRMLRYPVKENLPFFNELTRAVSTLLFSIYTIAPYHDEIDKEIESLVLSDTVPADEQLSLYLKRSFERLRMRIAAHPSGPLFKTLDLLREEERAAYDPWMQGNIPDCEASLLLGEKEISLLRIPAPIVQKEIEQAVISEEFITFLNTCSAHVQTLLYIDFQDRTSWVEHARTRALEGLSREALFSDTLIYINLAKESDFYNQIGLYRELSDADEFLRHFFTHLSDESTGYYFPAAIKTALLPHFIEQLLGEVHEHFFQSKARLTLKERLDLIDLVHQFVTLKIIEIVRPDFISLSSKDSLDVTAIAEIGFLALVEHGKSAKGDKRARRSQEGQPFDHRALRTLLFGPTLLLRERTIHPEQFARLYEVLSLLEQKSGYYRALATLFKPETLTLKIIALRPSQDQTS